MSPTSTVSENHIVLANDSVNTFKNEPITIAFNDSKGSELKVKINFVTDPSRGQVVNWEPSPDNAYLNLSIYNAETSGSTTSPLQIATEDESHKNIFMIFSFKKIGDSFGIQYTVFEER